MLNASFFLLKELDLSFYEGKGRGKYPLKCGGFFFYLLNLGLETETGYCTVT